MRFFLVLVIWFWCEEGWGEGREADGQGRGEMGWDGGRGRGEKVVRR